METRGLLVLQVQQAE
jgi:hypothetical protein